MDDVTYEITIPHEALIGYENRVKAESIAEILASNLKVPLGKVMKIFVSKKMPTSSGSITNSVTVYNVTSCAHCDNPTITIEYTND